MVLVNPEFEMTEVINEFPILKKKFEEWQIELDNLHEGESINEHFSKKSYTEDEISRLLRKINHELKLYLRNEETFNHLEIEEKEEEKLEEE